MWLLSAKRLFSFGHYLQISSIKVQGICLGFPGIGTSKIAHCIPPTLYKLIYYLCHMPDAMVTVAMEIFLCMVEANPTYTVNHMVQTRDFQPLFHKTIRCFQGFTNI